MNQVYLEQDKLEVHHSLEDSEVIFYLILFQDNSEYDKFPLISRLAGSPLATTSDY